MGLTEWVGFGSCVHEEGSGGIGSVGPFGQREDEEHMNKTKIFLLGGQSNMVGSGAIKDLAPPYSEALPVIRIWHPEKGWIALAPGYDGRSEFGPEIAFGHEIAGFEDHGHAISTELLGDKVARYGTANQGSATSFWNPGWSRI